MTQAPIAARPARVYPKRPEEIRAAVTHGVQEGDNENAISYRARVPLSEKMEDLLLRFDYSKVCLLGVILPLLTAGKVRLEVETSIEIIEIAPTDLVTEEQAGLLLARGANLRARTTAGLTARDYARRGNHADVIALLESQRTTG